jgi:hypothetical protein
VRQSTGETVKTDVLDVDGYFALEYQHRGKPAVYTIYLDGEFNLSQEVSLNSNGWASLEIDGATGTIILEQGWRSGGNGHGKNKD